MRAARRLSPTRTAVLRLQDIVRLERADQRAAAVDAEPAAFRHLDVVDLQAARAPEAADEVEFLLQGPSRP